MKTYIIHCAFGLGFAGAGAYARGYCKHRWHQVSIGVALVMVEALVMVNTVG